MTRLPTLPTAILVLTFLAGLTACGGPRLAPDPPAATLAELQGTWRLDAGASDDARAIVAAALPKPRRGREEQGAPPSQVRAAAGARPEDARPASDEARGSREGRVGPAELLRAFVVPPAVLRVGGTPREVVLLQDDRRRAFSPGDDTPYSITDRFGTRTVQAGWERDEFVVYSRDPRGLEVTERLRRGAAPDTLLTTVTLKARGLPNVRVQSTYRRTNGVVAPPSAAEGPPAPLR
jgi:hypothetical protein